MASCSFCGGNFPSAQAVRAHLKGCAVYKANKLPNKASMSAMSAVSASRARGGGSDGVRVLRSPVAAVEEERQRNKMRLVDYGKSYAERELQKAGVVSWYGVVDFVRKRLECGLTGTERVEDVEELVERLIEEPVEEARRAKAKERLIVYGERYAAQELEDADVDSFEWWSIRSKVRDYLKDRLTGEEGEAVVEELVEDVLDDLLC